MKHIFILFVCLGVSSQALSLQQWQGKWTSSFGDIYFIEKSIQTADAHLVFGNYAKTGTLVAVSIKGVLHGIFYDTKTQFGGSFTFTMGELDQTFTGQWVFDNKQKKRSWNGTLIHHDVPENLLEIDRHRRFESKWMSNFGPLDIVQDNVFVEGVYSDKGKIYGVYNHSNKTLFGLFTNKKRFGLLKFILNEEFTEFEGLWSWETKNWAEQKWTGTKDSPLKNKSL